MGEGGRGEGGKGWRGAVRGGLQLTREGEFGGDLLVRRSGKRIGGAEMR